jgi:hypothetical protein
MSRVLVTRARVMKAVRGSGIRAKTSGAEPEIDHDLDRVGLARHHARDVVVEDGLRGVEELSLAGHQEDGHRDRLEQRERAHRQPAA